jgi:hypothetical protein
MKLPTLGRTAPVEERQWHVKSKGPPPKHEYDDSPVLLRRDRYERFGRRTRRTTTLLAIGGSLSK